MSCSITAKKLCHNDNCNICFNRSFASNEKSKFLNDKNINPKILIKCSNKKYDFICDKCNHIFEASLNNINNNRWCSFCSNNKLCDKNDSDILPGLKPWGSFLTLCSLYYRIIKPGS